MISLALAYLRDRPLTTALNIALLAISVAMLVLLLQLGTQTQQRLERDLNGIDLVVGAKGSPTQLILSSVFHIDDPTGNIPLESLELLRKDPAVAQAVPLALGDNFRGFRIVGTDQSMLDLYGLRLAQGDTFKVPMQAVLGAKVARETGAQLGQQFVGSHGLAEDQDGSQSHDDAPFTAVGVLAPTGTVADRLIFVSIESVWDVHGIGHDHEHDHDEEGHEHEQEHEHEEDEAKAHSHHAHSDGAEQNDLSHVEEHGSGHDHEHDHEDHSVAKSSKAEIKNSLQIGRGEIEPELTAILVTYANASAAVRIPALINRQTAMQAAVPAKEAARVLSLLGASFEGVRMFAWLLAITGGLAIFVALLNMARVREGDLALIRVMGASRIQVFATVIMEGLITALLGAVLGWFLGHSLIALAGSRFATLEDIGLVAWSPLLGEAVLIASVAAIGVIAALIPAIRVYQLDPARVLARSGG